LDAIVKDAYVVGTHTADIYCFDAADSTEIFDLYAGEVADGIGYGEAAEALQFFAG
jgi:hypothetical protein